MKTFTARAMTSPRDAERDERLNRHRDLRPGRERHDVGRAEGGRVGDAQVEVVDKPGSPVGRRDPRIQLLREREVGVGRNVMGARGSAAAVEFPVEKSERDVVRHPDDRSGLEQVSRGVRLRPPVDEVADQLHRRPQCAEHEYGDQHNRERPKLARTTTNRDRVAGDHGHEQHPFNEREHPLRPQLHRVRQQDREDHRCQHRAGHRPSRLADDDSIPGRLGVTGGYRIVGRFGLTGHSRAS